MKSNVFVRVLLAVISIFVAVLSPAILVQTVGLKLFPSIQTNKTYGFLATFLMFFLVSLLAVVFVKLLLRYLDHRSWEVIQLKMDKNGMIALVIGTLASIAITFLVGMLLTKLNLLRDLQAPPPQEYLLLSVISVIMMAVLLQGFPEELIFRGYVYQTLNTTPLKAILISATVFAILHLVSSGGQQSLVERLMYLVNPFGFAILAGAFKHRYQSTWPAVGVHSGVHLGNMIGSFMGIMEGPTGWVVIGFIYVLAGALVYFTIPKQPALA